MPRVIGIISGKGGVGKTVVAINLAAALHKFFLKNVLIVDCNITTPHIGLYLGLYSTPITLNDALRGSVPVEKTIYEHKCGISVIPASLKLEDLKDVDWPAIKEKLGNVFDKFDFIVLDSSPGFGRESLITLRSCHEALFVTVPIVHSVADLIKCRQLAQEANIKPLGIVLNMVRNKKYELSEEEIREMVEVNVICSIPYDEKITESIISKNPIVYSSPAKVNREFKKLAEYVVGEKIIEKPSFLSTMAKIFRRMYFG